MKRTIALLGLALATVPLSSCAGDGYRYGYGSLSWSSYPYSGWYNDYYGPFYDGYWGADGFFYFRLDGRERSYRRDQYRHFRRDAHSPGDRFRRFEGSIRPPPRGTRMPNFPHDRDRSDRRGN